MTHLRHRLLLLAVVALNGCCVLMTVAEGTGEYLAVFADGRRVVGSQLADWNEPDSLPTLEGVPLEGDVPLRWFGRRAAPPSSPAGEWGFVAFQNGDVLCGDFVGVEQDAALPGQWLLRISAQYLHATPQGTQLGSILVRLESARRLNFGVAPRRFAENTAYLRGGAQVPFRSLRWSSDHLTLLMEDGIRTVPFDQLAELHLSDQSQEASATAGPADLSDTRWTLVETRGGDRLTASVDTFRAVTVVPGSRRLDVQVRLASIQRRREQTLEKRAKAKTRVAKEDEMFARRKRSGAATVERNVSKMAKSWQDLPDRERRLREYEQRVRKAHEQRVEEQYRILVERRRQSEQRTDETLKSLDLLEKDLRNSDEYRSALVSENTWFHACQPRWSVQPLWMRFTAIQKRLEFASDELPLTQLRPLSNSAGTPAWNATRSWQRDRNVFGVALNSAGQDYGWGFGVHGGNHLEFELPPHAIAFQTKVALDRAAGSGGCVRVAVHLDRVSETPAFQSPVIIGSQRVIDTGRIKLPASSETRRTLILRVDPCHRDRPDGADPFDIRDHVNWLEPIVILRSPARLRSQPVRGGE